jgi:hypothetical protein
VPRPQFREVSSRATIAVWSVAVALLQELLILAAQIALQHDAFDLRAFVAQALFDLQVRGEQLRIVLQLALSPDLRMKLLAAVIVRFASSTSQPWSVRTAARSSASTSTKRINSSSAR